MPPPSQTKGRTAVRGRSHGCSANTKMSPNPQAQDDGHVDWSLLIPHLIHATKVIAIEAMLWIDRPLSASELEKIAGGEPLLASFSYHLKHLAKLGILEVVAKCKVRESQGANKEAFFFFAAHRHWATQYRRERSSLSRDRTTTWLLST